MSDLEDKLFLQLVANGLPRPVREFKFANDIKRKWAFDMAFPNVKLAIEAEGGIYTRGRHVTPLGFQNDADKYNTAVALNWAVLRFTMPMIETGYAGIIARQVYDLRLSILEKYSHAFELVVNDPYSIREAGIRQPRPRKINLKAKKNQI